jgi:hypothetical protein
MFNREDHRARGTRKQRAVDCIPSCFVQAMKKVREKTLHSDVSSQDEFCGIWSRERSALLEQQHPPHLGSMHPCFELVRGVISFL